MKPETPLPWAHDGRSEISYIEHTGQRTVAEVWLSNDSQYIEHACNAYPKLVALAQDLAEVETSFAARNLLKELGELD